MAAVTICSDLEPPKIKSNAVSTVSPSICHEVMGPDAMIFVFWMLSFKPTFSLSAFTFIKRLFGSSSLSAIRVVSPAYLRLLIFLPAMFIPACALNNNKLNGCKVHHVNRFDIHTCEIISAIKTIIISITLYKVCLYPTVDLPSLLAPLQKTSNYSSTFCHYQFQFSGILLVCLFFQQVYICFQQNTIKFTILTIFKVCTPQ